jgi:hypothetical protein
VAVSTPTATGPRATPASTPTPTPDPGDGGDCPPSELDDPWQRYACEHRGAIDETFDYECPAGGIPRRIWGDVTYTDDSAVCAAAIHAGVIDPEQGGSATVRITPGRAAYVGIARNEITSDPWNRWPGSFEFFDRSEPDVPDCPGAAGTLGAWAMVACPYRGQNGAVLTFACPPGSVPQPAWGDGIYTDNSSVCTAATHAGVLKIEDGGTARIVIRPGEASYPGAAQNGVVTQPWPDRWPGSFEVVVPGASP